MNQETKKRGWLREGDDGFTLIELLIAIVVAGILTTVAIVGIGSLADNGKSSACKATADAAKAASAVYYANNDSAYPANFTAMISGGELDNSAGLTDGGLTLKNGTKWTVTMTAGSGNTAPTFTCS
ncbi:MAG TPA: prepilin-type N-terminal cleavage/methylation domain-containing protein [Acidimicrobiia bacterium]